MSYVRSLALKNDPQDILECGELVGFDEFNIINSLCLPQLCMVI
ncbi:hypothetical protein O9992_12980 [Vibrio lentus]|nr:hypothetical protein [Vibrio lentus]